MYLVDILPQGHARPSSQKVACRKAWKQINKSTMEIAKERFPPGAIMLRFLRSLFFFLWCMQFSYSSDRSSLRAQWGILLEGRKKVRFFWFVCIIAPWILFGLNAHKMSQIPWSCIKIIFNNCLLQNNFESNFEEKNVERLFDDRQKKFLSTYHWNGTERKR